MWHVDLLQSKQRAIAKIIFEFDRLSDEIDKRKEEFVQKIQSITDQTDTRITKQQNALRKVCLFVVWVLGLPMYVLLA